MNINDTLQYLNIGLPDDIARRKAWGDFEGAIRLIDLRLAQDNLSEPMRACLTAEREIICRIPQNYPFDRAAALAVVRAHIPDFTEEEFDERVDAGKSAGSMSTARCTSWTASLRRCAKQIHPLPSARAYRCTVWRA